MDIGNGQIYSDDCFNVFPKIEDKSVDMVLCDLPYACLHKRNPNTSWDVMLPMQPLWEQYRRVIKDDGAIVLFGQGVFSARLIMAAEDIFRYSLVWDKMRCTGFLNANRMPLRQHEDILVLQKPPYLQPADDRRQAKSPARQWDAQGNEQLLWLIQTSENLRQGCEGRTDEARHEVPDKHHQDTQGAREGSIASDTEKRGFVAVSDKNIHQQRRIGA